MTAAATTPAIPPQAQAATSFGVPHPNPFLERLIRFLMPYFIDLIPDLALARREILETLAAYDGRTRSEVLNAARIIAFSFASLDMLAESRAPELSPAMRLRYASCANGLNRSCQQNERLLAQRLDGPPPGDPPDGDQPDGDQPRPEPRDDMTDPAAEAAIAATNAQIAAYRNRPAAARQQPQPTRATAPEQEATKRLWGQAMVNVLADMGMPVRPVAPR